METGILIALGFAVAIIVLAVLLTRLFSHRGDSDPNGGRADGQANATWIGIRSARDDGRHDD